jgi:hypothetical protein
MMAAAQITDTRTVQLVFDTVRMPHTTQFRRIERGVEELYYDLLFTSKTAYQDRPDVWASWVEMGFGVGLQEGPPGADRDDRIQISMRTQGKRMTLTASGGDDETRSQLSALLAHIETLRGALRGRDDSQRADHVVADERVAAQLVTPVTTAIGQAGLSPADQQLLITALRRNLAALTHPELGTVTLTTD